MCPVAVCTDSSAKTVELDMVLSLLPDEPADGAVGLGDVLDKPVSYGLPHGPGDLTGGTVFDEALHEYVDLVGKGGMQSMMVRVIRETDLLHQAFFLGEMDRDIGAEEPEQFVQLFRPVSLGAGVRECIEIIEDPAMLIVDFGDADYK